MAKARQADTEAKNFVAKWDPAIPADEEGRGLQNSHCAELLGFANYDAATDARFVFE